MHQRLRWLLVVPAAFLLTPASIAASSTTTTTGPFVTAMQQAADARHVPLAVIEATAYVNTRWEWIGTPAMDGGVGPMKVRPSQLADASALSGRTPASITSDLASNLDAGA